MGSRQVLYGTVEVKRPETHKTSCTHALQAITLPTVLDDETAETKKVFLLSPMATTEVPTIRAELLHVILLTKIYDRIVPTDKVVATSVPCCVPLYWQTFLRNNHRHRG